MRNRCRIMIMSGIPKENVPWERCTDCLKDGVDQFLPVKPVKVHPIYISYWCNDSLFQILCVKLGRIFYTNNNNCYYSSILFLSFTNQSSVNLPNTHLNGLNGEHARHACATCSRRNNCASLITMKPNN